jgi:hypothetical protein
MEHNDRENDNEEEIDEGRVEIERVFTFLTLSVFINLTLAMASNTRLGKESVLRLMDEELIRTIAYHAVPPFTFSAHAYWRLCQEIIFKYEHLNLIYYNTGLMFFVVLNTEPFSFLSLSFKTFEVDENDVYSEDDPEDEVLNAVRVGMKHVSLNDFITRPAPVPHARHEPTGGNELRDPRDASNVVKGLHFLERYKGIYETNDYLLQTQKQKIMSIVDIILHIFNTMDTENRRSCSLHCSTKTEAPAAPTAPAALPAPDPTVRCPRCGVVMGEGGMPDALCMACWRQQSQ